MARLEIQHFVDIGQRLLEAPHHEIERGPLVPGLGEIRMHRHQPVENGERGVELRLVHRRGRLREQQFGGGRVRAHPQLPDRLFGEFRLVFALDLVQPGEQAVERLGAGLGRALARNLACGLARLFRHNRQRHQRQ
jgi:hypothetical protein